jgi:hypothetical protein
MLNFPQRGILANMKQGKGEKGLATLVSHIHSKINKTTTGWNKVTEQEFEFLDRSPELLLSPPTKQVSEHLKENISHEVSLVTISSQLSQQLNSRIKTSKSSRKPKSVKGHIEETPRVSQDSRKASLGVDQKKVLSSNKTSLSLTPKSAPLSKKKAASNDWLFDDFDMSIN